MFTRPLGILLACCVAFGSGCGDDSSPPATAQGGGGSGGATGGAGGGSGGTQPVGEGIPYVLDVPPTALEVEALLKTLRVEAEKNISQEIKDLVSKHASDQGISLGPSWVQYPASPPYGLAADYDLDFEPKTAADLLRMLAYEALFQSNLSVARWLFLWAAELAPGDPMFLNDAAFAQIQARDYPNAKLLTLRGLALDKDLHSLYVNLAYIYRAEGAHSKALLAILKAIVGQPKVVLYRQVAAEIFNQIGDTDSAWNQLHTAILLDPGNAEVQSQLAQTPEPTGAEKPPPAAASGLLVKILQCEANTTLEYGKKVMEAGGKEYNIDQDFQNEQTLNDSNCQKCCAACPPQSDGCAAGCWVAHCSASQASYAKARSAEVPLPGENEANYMQAFDYFMNCATPLLRAEKDSKVLEEGLLEVDRYYSSYLYNVKSFYDGAEEILGIWHDDVRSVCDTAEQAIEDAKTELAFGTVNNSASLDLCLDKALCVGINNSNVSISSSIGIFNGKLSADLETGAWAVSVGVGASDPTGTFQSGLSLKFHSTKGVALSGDVKIGGPIKVRLGGDFYLAEALK